MKITLVIPTELKEMPERLDNTMRKSMIQAQAVIEREAKGNVPVKTANLQRSIGSSDVQSIGGKLIGTVGVRLAQAKYGEWVEKGTGIYNGRSSWTIVPKNGKMLAFKQPEGWSGPVAKDGRALAHKVTVKGQKGQRYLARSAEENRERIVQIFRSAIEGVIKP